MALHFFAETAARVQPGDLVTLTGPEARHAAVVRRLRIGETVTVGDGQGTWLIGRAESIAADAVEVRVIAREEHAAPAPQIILVQALAKGDRDELAIQAACELGVDRVVPWQAARSISRWAGEKAQKGQQRWGAIVREAAKQAHRRWIPSIERVVTTEQLIGRYAPGSDGVNQTRMLVLDPEGPGQLSGVRSDGRDIVLVVGPEGGISAPELESFEAAGAERIRLGDTVLRTSTAGPAAISVLSVALGRW